MKRKKIKRQEKLNTISIKKFIEIIAKAQKKYRSLFYIIPKGERK